MRRHFRNFSTTVFLTLIGLTFGVLAYAQQPAPKCTPPPANMVSWWPGDGNADDIVGDNDGDFPANAFAPGKVGQAFSFDGSSYVTVPDDPSLDFTGQITVDAWVYPTSFSPETNGKAIVSKYDTGSAGASWDLITLPGTGQIQWSVAAAPGQPYFAVVTGVSLKLGVWQHVAATFDTVTQAIAVYIDGAQVPISCRPGYVCQAPTSIFQSSAPVQIGAYGAPTAPQGFWSGLIDEVELFNRALKPKEIRKIFKAGSAGKCKPVCNGLPQITAVDAVDFHGPIKGVLYDGSYYHYSLTSDDPADPADCVFDGDVHEEVFTIYKDCPGKRLTGFVSDLPVQHGADPEGFVNWIPDAIAFPRLDLSQFFSQSCHIDATQHLVWTSGTRTADLTIPANKLRQEINISPPSMITTTSFGCSHTTWYSSPPPSYAPFIDVCTVK